MIRFLTTILFVLAAIAAMSQKINLTGNPLDINMRSGLAITCHKIDPTYWLWAIAVQRIDGSQMAFIDINTPANAISECPGRFSNDGRYAFFLERPTGSWDPGQIEMIDLKTGERQMVVRESRPDFRLTSSFEVEGNYLYYNAYRRNPATGATLDYWVYRLDLTTLQVITLRVFDGREFVGGVVKGEWLYFTRRLQWWNEQSTEIWRSTIDGLYTEMVRSAGWVAGMSPSPRGHHLALKAWNGLIVQDLVHDSPDVVLGYFTSSNSYCWVDDNRLVVQQNPYSTTSRCSIYQFR